jgi:hypothetical protein
MVSHADQHDPRAHGPLATARGADGPRRESPAGHAVPLRASQSHGVGTGQVPGPRGMTDYSEREMR